MQITKEDIVQTGNLELLAKKAVEGFITGFHKSPFHGFSVEFAEHRQYNSGDNIRNIDWKLYGRTDKLYTKRFEEETNLRCQIVMDVSPSMQLSVPKSLSKLQFSAWSAAVFITMLKRQRDAAGLCTFDEKILDATKISSSGRHFKDLIAKLNKYLNYSSSSVKTDVGTTLHLIAEQVHRRSLIVVFTDFFETGRSLDAIFDAFQHLKHNKHEVIVIYTIDKSKELEFDYGNTPTTFVDLESGEKVKIQPREIRESYAKSMEDYFNSLKLKMAQYKIDFVEADINKSVDSILIPFLVKRNKMI
jgi:uncharacterized protein (DUF58 family)